MSHAYTRIVIALVLLALLAGCGGPATGPAASSTPGSSAPTASPTSAGDPATSEPERPTEAQAPTATAETTTEPSPTAGQQGGSPIVVLSKGRQLTAVDADGQARELTVPAMTKESFQIVASPDGSWLVGPSGQLAEALSIYNVASGEEQVVSEPDGTAGSFMFSPDGTSVLYMVKNYSTGGWRLKTLELASGEVQVVGQGGTDPGYAPIAWTEQGIIITQVYVVAADAGPETLQLLNPEDGSRRTILPAGDPYIQAAASPDGKKLAIVKGLIGLGIENPTPGLVIYDLASDEVTEVEPQAPGYIFNLRWSPDSSKLLYTRNTGGGPPPSVYTIVGPEQTEPQQIDLAVVPGQFRDVVWRDDETLLVLTAESEAERLYELPIAAPAEPDELGTIEILASEYGSVIIYGTR